MCIEKVKKLIYQYGILVFLTALIVIGFTVAGKVRQFHAWDKYVESASSIEQQIQLLEEKELVENGTVSFCLQGKEIPYIKSQNTYMISQKINSDESEKEQSFQGALSVHGMNAILRIEQDAYTDKLTSAIEEGHMFRAYLITNDAYQPVNIVLSGMPIVTLSTEYSETPEYSIEQIDDYVYNSETRYYGEIEIYDSTEIAGYDVCFHEKGQTSAIFDKHNYALKLLDAQRDGVEASMLGMPSSEKWKLQALYADVTKIREKTALDLWEEIANAERMTQEQFHENGAQMEYCEVIVDGEYQGLYGMMYPVNEDTLQMKSDDVLYKVLDWYMPLPEDIQASIDQNYEVCYPIRIRYPEKFTSVEKFWTPLQYYFACKYWGMNLELYADMTYMENLADFYIYIQAVSGFDNYLKNTYVWASKAENLTGYKMVTIPWDMNYTFGDCYVYDGDNNYTEFNTNTSVNYVEPVLEQMFRSNVNGSSQLLYEKWCDLRESILSTEHIRQLLYDNQTMIVKSGTLKREQALWTEVKNTDDIETLLQYVEDRMLYLDEYFGAFNVQ